MGSYNERTSSFKKKLLLLIIEDDPWTQKGLYSEVEGHISSEDQNTD